MRPIGPHSRPGKLAIVDGRSAEARRLKAIKAELAMHLGGTPSTTQRMMIERLAALMLRLELLDRKSLKAGEMVEHDVRQYLAWSNAVTRMLRQLGLQSVPEPAPSLADHIAARAAAA